MRLRNICSTAGPVQRCLEPRFALSLILRPPQSENRIRELLGAQRKSKGRPSRLLGPNAKPHVANCRRIPGHNAVNSVQ